MWQSVQYINTYFQQLVPVQGAQAVTLPHHAMCSRVHVPYKPVAGHRAPDTGTAHVVDTYPAVSVYAGYEFTVGA